MEFHHTPDERFTALAAYRFPDRFSRVVLSNGGLPTGRVPRVYTEQLREAYKTLPVDTAEQLGSRFRDTSGIPGFLYWSALLSLSGTALPR
jgi:haloalkane dehalogenase